jgi:serpin B
MQRSCFWIGASLAVAGVAVALASGTSLVQNREVAADEFILELSAPAGAKIEIDGRDFGTQRRFRYRPLVHGIHYVSRLEVRIDDRHESRAIDVVSGQTMHVAVLTPPPAAQPIFSDPDILATMPVSDATAERMPLGNAFALELYGQLARRPGNFVVSPVSLQAALWMVSEGADGETLRQIATALHIADNQDGAALAALRHQLELLDNSESRGVPKCEWRSANALWIQDGIALRDEFVTRMRRLHDASIQHADFAGDCESARRQINAWVASVTNDRIPELAIAGAPASDTRVYLANGVYFHGHWQTPFDAAATAVGKFHLRAEETVDVPMMKLTAKLRWAQGSDFQLLEIPYADRQVSMFVLLPDSDEELRPTASELAKTVRELRTHEVQLTLPRFQIDTSLSLAPTLAALGMSDAFGEEANFGRMSEAEGLRISELVHRVQICVDESGAEAAAATGTIFSPKSMAPNEAITFVADRPFMFCIQHRDTGTILFAGRLSDPTKASK